MLTQKKIIIVALSFLGTLSVTSADADCPKTTYECQADMGRGHVMGTSGMFDTYWVQSYCAPAMPNLMQGCKIVSANCNATLPVCANKCIATKHTGTFVFLKDCPGGLPSSQRHE